MATKTDKEPLTSDSSPADFGSINKNADKQKTSESQKKKDMAQNKYEIWMMPLLAEFVGQLMFAFMHSIAAQSVPVTASAINDGLFVAIMVITIGPISGAHVNSAVTLAVALAGGIKWIMVPLYIIVQLLGSLAGAGLAAVAFGSPTGAFALGVGVTVGQGVLCEIMLTILLVFAVLMGAVDQGSPIAAFGIGFAIVIDIFGGAKISGACMNPSLSFGPAVVSGQWTNYWVYWVGPVVGALIATALFRLGLGSREKRLFFNEGGENEDTAMKRQGDGEAGHSGPGENSHL